MIQIFKSIMHTNSTSIEGYIEENFQASSYNISIGSQCYLYDPKKKNVKDMIRSLSEYEDIGIPPNRLCFAISKELINMSNDPAGLLLKTYLIRKGIMVAAQPQLTPAITGKFTECCIIYQMIRYVYHEKIQY